MNVIDILKKALDDKTDVYLASSTFVEMTLQTPSVTLWIYDNVLNITSTRDYNTQAYYNKDTVKICDVYDLDTIIDIYNSTYGYTPKEEKINSLIGIFSRLNITK